MRAMAVVVINEDLKHTFEMPFVDDKQPIEAFGTNRPNEPLGDPVGLRPESESAQFADPPPETPSRSCA